jgi:hypothetical protein
VTFTAFHLKQINNPSADGKGKTGCGNANKVTRGAGSSNFIIFSTNLDISFGNCRS